MDRLEFEQYCYDNNWKIEASEGYVIVTKGDMIFKEPFMVGMPLRDLVHKMKEAEFGSDDVQGEFPFTEAGDLLV